MIRWLYDHIFRGLGIVLLIGMLTILYLAVTSQIHSARGARPAATASH
jgi:hypothetical protein